MPQQSPSSPAPSRAPSLVTVGGVTLRVAVRGGAPGRTPLLMFGGIGAGLEVLDPLVAAIDSAVPVIRLDPPGIGGSPVSPVPWTIPGLTTVVARLLTGLGHRQVDVLGYSWGGAPAQQFALQYPARCRRIVLVSSSTGVLSVPGDPQVLARVLVPRRVDDPAAAARLDDHLRDDLVSVLRSGLATAADGWGYLQQLTALAGWTSLPFLPWLTCPALVVNGADDPIVPVANARLLAALLPQATLAVIPGGHFEIVHAADALGARVSRFLA